MDLEQVEVLRGPQGTLFGRNSTGGAVSFITHDPTGEFGFRQQVTAGNYDQLRTVTRIELPAMGPLSAYLSFMHDEREGDTDNLDAGIVFDRTNSTSSDFGFETSPKTLGDNDSNSWRVAVKFEPNDNFNMVYKYDGVDGDMTPPASALLHQDPTAIMTFFGPGFGGAFLAATADGPVAGTQRPDAVKNGWTTPSWLEVEGHNLTLNWQINEQWKLKNIFAYRETTIYASTETNGTGQFFLYDIYYPGYFPEGTPSYDALSHNYSDQNQTSDEIQLNYASDLMDLTLGAMYYEEELTTGAPPGLQRGQLTSFAPLVGNVLPVGNDHTDVDAKSKAVFGQVEWHATEQLDLIAGVRYTEDDKKGTAFFTDNDDAPFTYNETKTTYNLGVSYQLTEDMLLYASHSTGYISGGSIAGVEFDPEEATSTEVGIKSDWFDQRLRVNLAVYDAKYEGVQNGVPGSYAGHSELQLVQVSLGDLDVQGFEAEITAMPLDGLTLTAGYTYTDMELKSLGPVFGSAVLSLQGLEAYLGASIVPGELPPLWLRPDETWNLSARYETAPLFDDARLVFGLDANWRSELVTPGFVAPPREGFENIYETGDYWLLNGRVALTDVVLSKGTLEIAVWGRNLTDVDKPYWGGYSIYTSNTTYEPARTYGVDVIYEF